MQYEVKKEDNNEIEYYDEHGYLWRRITHEENGSEREYEFMILEENGIDFESAGFYRTCFYHIEQAHDGFIRSLYHYPQT